jgi:hypothetical protein
VAFAANGGPAEGIRTQVSEALERIVRSNEFRGSQRSVDFLRFVVARWMEGDLGRIREKTIAVEVFGKAETYDPAEDSFVRVKASDLRKRLGAYYEGSGLSERVRIEIPLGSYQPIVHVAPSPAPEAATGNPKEPALVRYGWAGGLAMLVALSASLFWGRETELERLWKPMVTGARPVVISLPVLPRYQVLGQFDRALREGTIAPGAQIPADRVQLKDEVVGMGAGVGAAQLTGLLGRWKAPFGIKAGKDLRYSDLRSGPVVLLGGYSSAWTLDEMKSWRYRMIPGPPGQIADTQNLGQTWRVEGFRTDGRADRDFALITKVATSSHGNAILALSGITTFGTQAAAEFVVQEERVKELFGRAPKDWSGANLQAVISMRVKDDTPGPAKLEAAWFW